MYRCAEEFARKERQRTALNLGRHMGDDGIKRLETSSFAAEY
jgi:hypothetical protein